MNENETNALNLINETMNAIQTIDNKKLKANEHELIAAIHILQMFVKQHYLHRIEPTTFANWWEE